MLNIRKFSDYHSGMWSTSHVLYYQMMHSALLNFKKSQKKYAAGKKKYLEKYKNEFEDLSDLHSYVNYKLEKYALNCDKEAISIHLFACFTIEAFLNFVGVKIMGEKFYQENINGAGAKEKVSILLLIDTGEVVSRQDRLVKKICGLFEKRSSLVHPKVKETSFTELVQNFKLVDLDSWVNQVVVDFEYILDEFCNRVKVNKSDHFPENSS